MTDSEELEDETTVRSGAQDFASDVRRRISEFESRKTFGSLLSAPKMIRRELQEMSFFGVLTAVPALTVVICLLVTAFLAYHSGIADGMKDEASMNVNGDLAAFLPEGSAVAANIAEVEEDWTTNVMIIYVESGRNNITDRDILIQMDLIEAALNSVPSDDGEDDEIIYILSISSVVKEINSSAPRVADAFVRNAGQACPVNGVCDWLAENASEFILDNGDVVGGYNIPEEQDRIDQIIGELPPNAQDKLVRDVGEKKNGTFVDT